MYCPNCGHNIDGPAVPAEPAEPTEVILARIQADRDIAVARLEAGARRAEQDSAETIARVEAAADIETAEAVAEIIAADDEPEPEAAGEPEPVVIVEESPPEPEPAEEPPPEIEHHDAERHSRGLGMW
jgi:hypothetical protein